MAPMPREMQTDLEDSFNEGCSHCLKQSYIEETILKNMYIYVNGVGCPYHNLVRHLSYAIINYE